jgi:transposase-like protein
MTCLKCESKNTKRFGKDRKGNQRFRCLDCNKTFLEPRDKPLDEMRLPIEKALLVLHLLVEGNSVRSTERITGVEKKTILSLLIKVGEKCDRIFEKYVRNLKVADVQADEIWGFVKMKDKTRKRKGEDEEGLGDAYLVRIVRRRWQDCRKMIRSPKPRSFSRIQSFIVDCPLK